MNVDHLKCFLAAADTLHFGRAAQSLDILPASLGRQIRQLEDRLGTRLFQRTTRAVSLTETGSELIEDARRLVTQAEAFERKARTVRTDQAAPFRIGAIDSAAVGLIPQLLQPLQEALPNLDIQIIEQKTIHLLPRLLNGSIDLAICRPPDMRDPRIVFRTLFYETAVVALPSGHPLSTRSALKVEDLCEEPLIVPDRRSRPHSHDLTIKLFTDVGLSARIAQVAEEKQTIVHLVAAGTGMAIVPRWTARLRVEGVVFLPLLSSRETVLSKLILAAAWPHGTRDPARDVFLRIIEERLATLEDSA